MQYTFDSFDVPLCNKERPHLSHGKHVNRRHPNSKSDSTTFSSGKAPFKLYASVNEFSIYVVEDYPISSLSISKSYTCPIIENSKLGFVLIKTICLFCLAWIIQVSCVTVQLLNKKRCFNLFNVTRVRLCPLFIFDLHHLQWRGDRLEGDLFELLFCRDKNGWFGLNFKKNSNSKFLGSFAQV